MRTLAAVLAVALATPAMAEQLGAPAAPPVAAPEGPAGAAVAPRPAAYGKSEGVIPGMVIGPKLSLLAVPTPSIGLEAKFQNRFGLSFDYDLLPDVDLGEVEVGYTDWNLAAKWYPWQRSFFVGAAFGTRSFHATATDALTGYKARAEVSTRYLAPEIGWRWVWNSGFFMGMDLGYQIVLSSETTLDIPELISTTEESEDVKKAGDEIGKIGLPIVTLLQVGFFF